MSRLTEVGHNYSDRLKQFLKVATNSSKKRFVISTMILFTCFGYWSIATPMFASPDEPAHLVRAEGISSGDFYGTPQAVGEPIFSAPIILTSAVCFAFNPNQTADCLSLSGGSGEAPMASAAASYPPLAHVIYSIPFFFSSGVAALYQARLIGALACALLFALGITSLSRGNRTSALSVGVALGLTPMVMLSCATVNPSGVAIAAAFATWSGGLAISKVDKHLVDMKMMFSLMLPFAIFLAMRRDSMLWGVAIMLCLLVLIRLSTILHLLKKPSTMVFCGLIASELLLQLFVWGGPGGQGLTEAGPILGGTTSGNGKAAFGSLPSYFHQAIGVLGWLDAPLPIFVFIFWQALFIGIFILSAATAKFRLRLSMFIVFCVFIVLPVKVGSVSFPYFQGRYALPLLIGAPLLATFYLRNSPDSILGSIRPTRFICIMIWLMGIASFAESFRRYSVGLNGGWSELKNPRWNSPALSTHFLLATYPIVLLALMMWLIGLFNSNQFRISPCSVKPELLNHNSGSLCQNHLSGEN